MRRIFVTVLLATAALLLVPASQAFATGLGFVSIEGSGAGEVSTVGGNPEFGFGEGTPAIECTYEFPTPAEGTCENEADEVEPGSYLLTFHAIPSPGSEFVEFVSEEGFVFPECGATQCNLLNAGEGEGNIKVVAIFDAEESEVTEFPLVVTKTGSGEGTVTSSPAGINCGSECEAEFEEGTEVTLTATPESGSEFTGWSGAGCSGTGTCKVTIEEEEEVTATFEPTPEFSLEVELEGTGQGTVTSSPSGINCPGSCEAEYEEGEEVTLTATPESGSEFTGWSGDCTGTGTCKVTMSEGREVTATFDEEPEPEEFTLEVELEGTGSGTVTSSPAGINCGGTCSAQFEEGEEVTLTATPEAGSEFSGWSGDCTGTGTCKVTMSEDREVTATFDEEPTPEFALTVSKTGTGSGTITSSPAGIDCGATCSAKYEEGTEVTLTATPASGSTFAGWSGACTGPEACKVTISEARAVTATFTAEAVNPPPPPPPALEGKAKAASTAKVKSGKASVKLTCSGGPCKGQLKLTAKVKQGKKTKNLTIGKASFNLAEGATTTLKVKLSAPAKQALSKKGKTLKAKTAGTGITASTVKLKKA